jgi:hypothetical protein
MRFFWKREWNLTREAAGCTSLSRAPKGTGRLVDSEREYATYTKLKSEEEQAELR